MLTALVRICLQFRWAVVLVAAVGFIVASVSLRKVRVDAFPEFAPPLLEVQTEAPGFSSLQVEALVSLPIEAALQSTPGIKTLRSKSVLGLSSVVLYLNPGTETMVARQFVQERLARIQLPQTVRAPVTLPPLSATSRVMKVGVTSVTLKPPELAELIQFTVRPRLLAVPGVANVAVWGEQRRTLQVQVDVDKIGAAGLRLDEVLTAVREAAESSGGGFIESPTQRLAVVTSPAFDSIATLEQLTIRSRAGATTLLHDVAKVSEGAPPAIGDAVINGKRGLLLIVEKQPSGNTLEVTLGVEAALQAVSAATPGVEYDAAIFRPATFVERSITNLFSALALGCLLVVLVLAVFLAEWRTAMVSVIAIPLSLVAAATVMNLLGLTLDTMALAGLAIAVGEVVDDAIIDVENILRRLQENRHLGLRKSAFAVVLAASVEVRSAVVFASLVVTLVFLPLFFLEGLAGAFFRPLAMSYILAVAASLFVALTLTPALSLLLLGDQRDRKPQHVARWCRARLGPIVAWAIARPKLLMGGMAASLTVSVLLVPWFDESFLPAFKETDFLMHWVGRPGTSLTEMRRLTERVSHELLSVPGIHHFGSHIGRAEAADEVVGANFAELWISVDDTVNYAQTLKRVHEIVAGYPGVTRDVQTYLQERAKEVLTGASGGIVVRLFGPDLDVLRTQGARLARLLEKVPGIVNLKVEPQAMVPQVELRLKVDAAALLGVTAGEFQRFTATMLQGTRVGQVTQRGHPVDVVVTGSAAVQNDVTALQAMPFALSTGTTVPVEHLATVEVTGAPNVLLREGASRKLDVSCDASGRDLKEVVADIQAAVKNLTLPPEHHAEVVGEGLARQEAKSRLLWLSLLVAIAIGLVLYVDFRSLRLVALVLGTLPFALVGGVSAVAVTGAVMSLGSLIGFVTVLGVASRNGIMLVSHFRHLEMAEGVDFGPGLVVRGTVERVAPILMTALAAGLALLPLVFRGAQPGYEIEHPMAVVILGGLLSSTVMNLVLLPGLYLRFGRS